MFLNQIGKDLNNLAEYLNSFIMIKEFHFKNYGLKI